MPRLTVDADGRQLLRDGEPFPLIVDTAWSSFADPSESEWRGYLATRRAQGFSAVLVSLLPILHDRDERADAREPFGLDSSGRHDFSRPNDEYFTEARRFTRIAHEEYGIHLMVAVLWNNYVPGTWGAALTPWAVMPDAARERYLEQVIATFAGLDPVYVVGGDDSYDVPAANAVYLAAARRLRAAAPDALLTTHSAPNAVLPDELLDALDLHLHQSGHNVENRELTWRQPPRYLARLPRKPLLASEPPYELHGKVNGSGRWSREEVRRASWESVLAGSTAGIGYGAHGMWMWHTPLGDFAARGPSLEPLLWPTALALPGARDISLLARLSHEHRLARLDPAQDLLVDPPDDGVRVGASADRALVVVYLPDTRDVILNIDLTGYRLTAWDLAERAPLTPGSVADRGITRFAQLPSIGDQLVIAEARP